MIAIKDRDPPSKEEERQWQRLAKQQELLREQLERATSDLRQLASDCKLELPKTSAEAQQLCETISRHRISDDQQVAAESARNGQPTEAANAAAEAARKLEALLSQCCNSHGVSQDIDSGLGLSKQQLRQALDQLQQAQGVLPQIGQRSGANGDGFAGSRANASVFGPQSPSGQKSHLRARDASGKDGVGTAKLPDPDEIPNPAETLVPKNRSEARDGVGNLNGVPVGYRDQAEAYFRRLSQDQSTDK